MEKIKLIRPIEFDGKKYTEIDFDFDGLTGEDMINAERQYMFSNDINQANALKELSKEYQILIAAKAAKMPVEFFKKLFAKDFSRITIKTQNFLLREDSEVED